MHFLFSLVRYYPYLALPLAVILVELARYFRRRASKAQYYCLGLAGFLLLLTLLWFVFRGDLHSDDWVRRFLGLETLGGL